MGDIIVTGGRTYNDRALVFDVLRSLQPSRIIQGGCSGADALAREYAALQGVECVSYRANWGVHGKKAGPMRNKRMLEENPDAVVVIFPGGRGTDHCAKLAELLGMHRYHITESAEASPRS